MNNDLISRSALQRCLQAELEAAKEAPDKTCAKAILDMLIDVKLAPAVDAEPVRHGRWIDDRTEMVCSECNAVYSDEIVFMNKDFECNDPPYCPNCGAKMDAEVSE